MMELTPDGNLDHYASRVSEKQNELADIAFQLEVSREIAALQEHPSWPKFIGKMSGIRDPEIRRMLRDKMGEYDLGKRQGRISTMDVILATKPLSQEEVDTLLRKADTLRAEIQDLQNILS